MDLSNDRAVTAVRRSQEPADRSRPRAKAQAPNPLLRPGTGRPLYASLVAERDNRDLKRKDQTPRAAGKPQKSLWSPLCASSS